MLYTDSANHDPNSAIYAQRLATYVVAKKLTGVCFAERAGSSQAQGLHFVAMGARASAFAEALREPHYDKMPHACLLAPGR